MDKSHVLAFVIQQLDMFQFSHLGIYQNNFPHHHILVFCGNILFFVQVNLLNTVLHMQ